MREMLGVEPDEVIDYSGAIGDKSWVTIRDKNGKIVKSMGRQEDLRPWMEERGMLEPDSAFARTWTHYVNQLDPAEAERVASRPLPEQFRAVLQYSRNLPPEALAALAAAGHRGKGWYKAAAESMATVFGEDAPQVSALLAALSPNVGVDDNVRMAMDLWSEWVAAGKPRKRKAIEALFNSVRYNKGENTYRPSFAEAVALDPKGKTKGAHGVVSNAIENTVRVLSMENPVDYFSDPKLWEAGNALSGPKVDPFFANLMGEFRRFTNDTHMNRLSAMKTNNLTNRAAQTAAYQDAADLLTRELGLRDDQLLQMANMQENPWGVGREMPLLSGYGNTEEYFFPGGGDLDLERFRQAQLQAAQAPDVAELLQEGETAENLTRAGYDPSQATARRTGVDNPEEMDAFALENQEGIRRATRRQDMHNAKDFLMQGLLVGGAGGLGAAAQQGLLPMGQQEGETPALFQRGRGLL
jgi:hypothetical protein